MHTIGAFTELISSEKVTVAVGSEGNGKSYSIPKSLLVPVAYFEKALKEDAFKEGADKRITLPEDSAQAFELFQYFLYHQDLAFGPVRYDVADEENLQAQETEACLRAWVFGDKYGVKALQNAAMLRACELLKQHPPKLPSELLDYCYDSTMPRCALRKLIAEYLVDQIENHQASFDDFEGLGRHSGFLHDFAAAMTAYHARGPICPFPRSRQPHKNRDIFYTVSVSSDVAVIEPDEPADGYAVWDPPRFLPCEHCGLEDALVRCKGCLEMHIPECSACDGVSGIEAICDACKQL